MFIMYIRLLFAYEITEIKALRSMPICMFALDTFNKNNSITFTAQNNNITIRFYI